MGPLRSIGPVFLLSLLFLFFAASCETVPVTGRQQLSLVPDQQIRLMSFDAYKKFIADHQVIRSGSDAKMVKRVGRRIQKAVERYAAQHGFAQRLQGYAWEFNLIKDPAVNAFAMPGGKVAVFTGILPVTRDEPGLSVVMGHEIAHVIAQHGNERMSQGLLAQLGGMALSTAVTKEPVATQRLFMAAYGVGTQVGVLLPYSRLQESEADHLGLVFMAMAGYDPREAVDFWRRMARQKQGEAPPEFLSTHPADDRRIRNIQELIPEAMQYYQEAIQ